uniref:Uncharacterized protein n=1 Tax=Oryza glumipatula TaxID=40148 RepID=A0A0E0AD73_9ORYZ
MALHLQSIGPLARFRLSTHTYQGQPGLFGTISSHDWAGRPKYIATAAMVPAGRRSPTVHRLGPR